MQFGYIVTIILGGENMEVRELKNYGKDIITVQDESKLPINKKLKIFKPTITFLFNLIKEMSISGFIKFVKLYKLEKEKAFKLDWSHIEQEGISKEHLQRVVEKEVMAKVLVDKLGLDKAKELRNSLSDNIAYYVLEHAFATPQEFIECGKGDFLLAFKDYYIALSLAMEKAGLEKSEVAIDTKDCFQLNITYCVYHEVAKTLGCPHLCYYSTCYGDEVFFPRLCEQVGFRFERDGTLSTGNSVCDMRFIRENNK